MEEMKTGNHHRENTPVTHDDKRALTEGIVPPTELFVFFPGSNMCRVVPGSAPLND